MCCTRYYVRALKRVPTSGREGGREGKGTRGRMVVAANRKRVNLDGWMDGWGYTEDGRDRDRKGTGRSHP